MFLQTKLRRRSRARLDKTTCIRLDHCIEVAKMSTSLTQHICKSSISHSTGLSEGGALTAHQFRTHLQIKMEENNQSNQSLNSLFVCVIC